jgi:type IV pilus assembly protein PilV
MIAYQKNMGSSMIEILVTIIILMIGLLGLAGLQGRAMTSQMEAYQRSQALILLKDMADRINANRVNAAAYVAAVGTGAATPASTPTNVDLDK